MLGGFLDSIPGVGHVKGVLHYATGNKIAAKKSMYEASRSTAVIAGGAVGALGGPVGIVAGAAAAGAATDTLTSLITQKPQGIISGVSDIVEDISSGSVPFGSVVRTGIIVGSDIVGGLTGPALGNCAIKVISESAGKGIIIKVATRGVGTVVKSTLCHGAARSIAVAVEETEYEYSKCKPSSSNASSGSSGSSNGQSSTTSQQTDASKESESSKSSGTSGSGGQPPNNNQNNNNKKEHSEEQTETHWETFLKIFKIAKLEDIIINGKNIFNKLNSWQKKELKDFIINVNNNYKHFDLGKIVNITLELLSEVGQDQVTSHNFVNIAKFVLAYLCEKLTEHHEAFRDRSKNFITCRAEHANKITSEIAQTVSTVTIFFRNLMSEITLLSSTIDPQFVNIVAAVYHYFKHKFVKIKNRLFTPAEYFNFARIGLNRLQALAQCTTLKASDVRRIVYQKYYGDIGRRLMVVIKLQGEKWNLTSCYFEDNTYEGDEDGDEWINDNQQRARRHLSFNGGAIRYLVIRRQY